ncbi:MAG: hypothetical protein AB1629_02740 [Candidatus Omnitrophota bacterium]
MANFYSASPFKRLVKVILIVVCLVIIFDTFLSLFLFRYVHRVINNIDPKLGKIYISQVSIDFLRGIVLQDVSIVDNATPPQILFQAKKLNLKFDPLSILNRELNFNRIKCVGLDIYINKDSQTLKKISLISKAAYEEFLKNQILPLELVFKDPSVNFISSKFIVADFSGEEPGIWIVRLKGMAALRNKKIFSQGSVNLEHKLSATSSFINLFRNQFLSQDFDYRLIANLKKNDFLIEDFDIMVGYDHIKGQAIVSNFTTSKPIINLIVNTSNLSIENITSLIKDFDTRGSFNLSAAARGPLDNLKFIITLNFLGCTFRYSSFPVLKNIVGKVKLTESALTIDNLFLIFNDVGLNVNSRISQKQDTTQISADISIKPSQAQIAFLPRSININSNWQRKNVGLGGNLSFTYEATDNNKYSMNLEEVAFLKENVGGSLKAKKVIFRQIPLQGDKEKKFDLSDFAAKFEPKKGEFNLSDIKVSGFSGQISANIYLGGAGSYRYASSLLAQNLDASQIQAGLAVPYNLLGFIWAKIFSSSTDRDFTKGILLIKKGKLQETALLLSLAEYLNINSLKAIDFDEMQLRFSFLKNGVFRYGLKSKGKDVVLDANFQIGKDQQLSGYFNANINHTLLMESNKLRRLLKMIGDESASVDFPFKLGGTIHKPRLSWLRNDFKRSLEHVIPAWYRQGMQKGIDDAVEEMFKE